MNWQPASEYNVELGHVLVWLEWRLHAYKELMTGQPYFAYQIVTRTGPVWVDAKDCTPIETTGREVTHLIKLRAPSTIDASSAHEKP